ncbi:MAG: hypothetical protein ACMUJI_01685 [Erythrobacter sp.]|uniref:hypothetical protein n=1 Tax=Erythrobacter TaxID=1041 RepID=UPI00207ABD4F|nr:hypothetical protein [Erythrobacter aurantius]
MKMLPPLAAAAALLVFAAPALSNPAQDAPAQQQTEQEQPANEQTAPAVIEIPAITAPDAAPAETTDAPEAEEELICRSIRLDMSSRRKTRVCRTEEGWRQLNQQR